MIKVENIVTFGLEQAVHAMRHPHESYSKSDSKYIVVDAELKYQIGKNDLGLMQRLYKAGIPHRTYARMIEVWMDVTAPLYLYKELDRYSVGKAQVSCSTMHSIHKKPFELNDFSYEHLFGDFKPFEHKAYEPEDFLTLNTQNVVIRSDTVLMIIIEALNFYRHRYLETGEKKYWWQMIQLLPSSYNQKRTIMMSYEVVFKIIEERSGHKLDEWVDFVEILKDLPYVREIMGEKPADDEQLPGQITIDEYMEGKA